MPKTLDTILRYDWPGNVRELDNVLERAVLLSRGNSITPQDLPPSIQGAQERELSLVSVPPRG